MSEGLSTDVTGDERADGLEVRHLTNLYDPTRSDAKYWIAYGPYETQDEAHQRLQRLLADRVIGRPKATEALTVEQLEAAHFVGIYAAAKEGAK